MKAFVSSRRTVLDEAMEEEDSLHPKFQGNSWPFRKNHGTSEGEDQIGEFLGAYCPIEDKDNPDLLDRIVDRLGGSSTSCIRRSTL